MKYTARIYYSTYCEYEVEAENECEAIEKAQNLKGISKNQFGLIFWSVFRRFFS